MDDKHEEFRNRLVRRLADVVNEEGREFTAEHGSGSVQPSMVLEAILDTGAAVIAAIRTEEQFRASLDAMMMLSDAILKATGNAEDDDDDGGERAPAHDAPEFKTVSVANGFGMSVPLTGAPVPSCPHCAILHAIAQWSAEHGERVPGDADARAVSLNDTAGACIAAAATLVANVPEPGERESFVAVLKDHLDDVLRQEIEKADKSGRHAFARPKVSRMN